MVLLEVSETGRPSTEVRVKRYPFLIGRSADADLRLTAAGVWEKHLTLDWERGVAIVARSQPEATTVIAEKAVSEARLRNGDRLELGAVKLRFWLDPPRAGSMQLREGLTWACVGGLLAAQGWVVAWLMRG